MHNKGGSATVAEGDRVVVGQKQAELGNTHSTVPHLHFAVWSADWAVSVPVRFKGYQRVVAGSEGVEVRDETPQEGEVLQSMGDGALH